MNRRGHDGNVINWIVAAVNSQFARVVDQQRRQDYLDQNHGGWPRSRPFRDDSALGQLHDSDGQQGQLLVAFLHRRQHRQTQQEDQPEQVHPLDTTLFFVVHRRPAPAPGEFHLVSSVSRLSFGSSMASLPGGAAL